MNLFKPHGQLISEDDFPLVTDSLAELLAQPVIQIRLAVVDDSVVRIPSDDDNVLAGVRCTLNDPLPIDRIADGRIR